MYPSRFRYEAPRSLDEAITMLRDGGDYAKVLAGGQSLVPLMKLRFASPELVVDINNVPGLDYHRADPDGTLRIGAGLLVGRPRPGDGLAGDLQVVHKLRPGPDRGAFAGFRGVLDQFVQARVAAAVPVGFHPHQPAPTLDWLATRHLCEVCHMIRRPAGARNT